MLNWDGANETDVREELATPLLEKLGYRRGTSNDIWREHSLKYEREQLGRKKASDPPLRGKADYVLSVGGVARWVFELKAPTEAIDEEVVGQCLSYARHAEVSAVYAVVTNGQILRIYGANQFATDEPLLEVEIRSLEQAINELESTLSPSSISRQYRLPLLSKDMPVADGFRGHERVRGGQTTILSAAWHANIPLPPMMMQKQEALVQRLHGMRHEITDGQVARNQDGQIIVKIRQSQPHYELAAMQDRMELGSFEYVCLDAQISSDPERPSVFEILADIPIKAGDHLFDVVEWRSEVAGISATIRLRGQVTGFIQDTVFVGFYNAEYDTLLPGFEAPAVTVSVVGSVEVEMEP